MHRARSLATLLLQGQDQRLAHVAAAAKAASYVALRVPSSQADTIVAAAWLHDIGFATSLRRSGFHPLDGAIYLQDLGWGAPVVSLVAHHSHSRVLAAHLHLGSALAAFPEPDEMSAHVLAYADVVAGADGRGATLSERVSDLRRKARGAGEEYVRAEEERYELLSGSVARIMVALRAIPERAVRALR